MTVIFRPAARGKTPILLGLAGPSRSGKTYSALRIAMGLAGGDASRVFVVDTESGRARQYVERFGRFMHLDIGPPFTSEKYLNAITAAEKAGAVAIIVDSMSHEHEGPGGILEQHEQELSRMAGDDWQKRERVKFAAWIKPKRGHNRFVNAVLQINCHMIFCFRAKDKLALVKNDKGKQEPVSLGWQPICADRFEYEMSAMIVLPEGAEGVPDLTARATGLREPLDQMLRTGKPLDEDLGRRLADWSAGEADPRQLADAAAQQGTEAFRAWWNGEGKQHRAALRADLAELQAVAAKADTAAAPAQSANYDDFPGDAPADDWDVEVEDILEGLRFGTTRSAVTRWQRDHGARIAALPESWRTRVEDAYRQHLAGLK